MDRNIRGLARIGFLRAYNDGWRPDFIRTQNYPDKLDEVLYLDTYTSTQVIKPGIGLEEGECPMNLS